MAGWWFGTFLIFPYMGKNGKTGVLGSEGLKVRWEVALFFVYVVI